MRVTYVRASNWRNFKTLDFPVEDRLFIVGPNASGKSNLLDLFRFISDITSAGGGLAAALEKRGGLSKARSLFARNHRKGLLEIDLELSDGEQQWRYQLSIKGEKGGRNRPVVSKETVECDGEVLLDRPNSEDVNDSDRLTQTHLEQIAANQSFRALADYFGKVRYFHLVPQVIRDPGRLASSAGGVYGSDFIAQMNAVQPRTRTAWSDACRLRFRRPYQSSRA